MLYHWMLPERGLLSGTQLTYNLHKKWIPKHSSWPRGQGSNGGRAPPPPPPCSGGSHPRAPHVCKVYRPIQGPSRQGDLNDKIQTDLRKRCLQPGAWFNILVGMVKPLCACAPPLINLWHAQKIIARNNCQIYNMHVLHNMDKTVVPQVYMLNTRTHDGRIRYRVRNRPFHHDVIIGRVVIAVHYLEFPIDVVMVLWGKKRSWPAER